MRASFTRASTPHFAMAFHLLVGILFLTGSVVYGQTTIIGGTTLKVSAGTSLVTNKQLVIKNLGILNNEGTIILKSDLDNQNSGGNSLGTGALVFSGTISQSITGQSVAQNLALNNPAGLTVAGNTRVNGILNLTAGPVSLGTFNLLLGSTATVAGSPSSANMIVATGTGQLQKEFTAAGSFTFPVGDATAAAEYSPVTLAFASGIFGAGSYAGVSLNNAAYAGVATSYITRYWNVSQSGITGFSCNAAFQYVLDDAVGAESDVFCFKVDPVLPWIAYNAANTGTHELTAHGLSSFGNFTGNFGNAAIPPVIRSLQDKTISTGPECADANQTMLIAGNGTTYIVTSSGNVKHIAGTNIIYYPGTRVDLGGYLHGYISSSFCTPYIHPGATAPFTAGIENQETGKPNNSFFRIYPNPTPGKFTMELNGDVTISQVHVEIFGILGDRILSKEMQIDRKQEFSLVEKPTGVYVVHVTSGVNSETEKIIKQ